MSLPREVASELTKIENAHQRAARRKSVAAVPAIASLNKVSNAVELMACVFPEPRWAVLGILPEGVNIMAGRPKIGKSWAALNIAVAVACGRRALGAIEVEAGDVLYLALEDGKRRLQDRLGTTLAGGDVPKRFYYATTWALFDEGGLHDIKSWLNDPKISENC